MTIQETFIRADQALNAVVQQIRNDQWQMEMPEGFSATTRKDRLLTLRDVINYHAYDEAWVPDMVAGKTMEEAGKDKYNGDLLGDNPKKRFAELVEKGVEAVRDLHDLDRTIHFSYADFPAYEGLKHITSFRGLRVYDLSKVLGLDTGMDDDLVRGLWDMISPVAEEWRALGVFNAKIAIPEDAPLQDRLLGLTGRQP